MGKVTQRQHEPLYAPHGWTGEAQSFVNKLERILDDIYQKLGTSQNSTASGLTDEQAETLERVGAIDHDTFVVQEDGKGLSTNDFTDEDKENLDRVAAIDHDTYVVQEDGKGLSSNDFTDDDKSNLDALVSEGTYSPSLVSAEESAFTNKTFAATTNSTVASISLAKGYLWLITATFRGAPSASAENDVRITLQSSGGNLAYSNAYNAGAQYRCMSVTGFLDLRTATESGSATLVVYPRTKFVCLTGRLEAIPLFPAS